MTFRTVAPLLLFAAACSSVTAATQPSAYELRVELVFAARSGDEGAREEFELQLLSELRRAGCFRSVQLNSVAEPATDAAALDLRLTVVEFFEETTYDTSLAARANPDAPPDADRLYTSHFRAIVDVVLELPPERRLLRRKTVRGSASHRPSLFGEDARDVALRGAVERAVRGVRIFICKGGAKRLAKEIDRSASR